MFSLRGALIFVIAATGVVLAFIRPIYGLLSYEFFDYVKPDYITHHAVSQMRLQYWGAVALIISMFTHGKPFFVRNFSTLCLFLMWFIAVSTTFFFSDMGLLSNTFIQFSKVFLIALIISSLITNTREFKWYCFIIVLFVGVNAARQGFGGLAIGGSHNLTGPMNDNNLYGQWLVCSIPFTFYFMGAVKKRYLKILLSFVIVGQSLAVLWTDSRGGFLGLCAVWIIFILKSKHKIILLLVVGLAAFGYLNMDVFTGSRERTSTISTAAEKDSSAIGRIHFWKVALIMMKDNPLGLGLKGYKNNYEKYDFSDGLYRKSGRAVHNSFLQIGTELGWLGLALFLILIGRVYLMNISIRKKLKKFKTQESKEIISYTQLLDVAFVGFIVTGTFVSQAFSELPWHMFGLSMALKKIADQHVQSFTQTNQLAHQA